MGQIVNADELLKKHLQADEQILWSGKPEPFGLLEGKSGKKIMIKMAVAAAVVLPLVLAYILCVEDWRIGVVAAMLVILAVIELSSVNERSGVLKQQYWITTRKIVLIKDQTLLFAMDRSRLDDCQVVDEGLAKGKNLVMGSKLFEELDKHPRWRSGNPLVDESKSHVEGMIFYNIPQAEKVAKLLQNNVTSVSA